MKVLLINNQHYLMGGAHVVYFNTAELLKKNGHEVFFFSTKDNKTLEYEYSNYFAKTKDFRELSISSKIKFSRSFIYNKDAYIKLNRYIKQIKPDIAHVHLFMGGLTASILKVLGENNIPIVHSVHDYRLICPAYLFLDANNNICEKCKKNKYFNCILNKCSESKFMQSTILALDSYNRLFFSKPQRYIDSYLFVSDFSMQKHIEYEYDDESKMTRIYNFMPDIDKILPNHIKGEYMLYLGRLSREKGITTLVKVANETNVNLKIAGNGPLLNELKEKTSKNIEFLGFISGEKLIDIIKNASFVIVPSECYENNPMSIIESYAYGKPVIGANIGGIPEIITNNKTGFLFESGRPESLKEKVEYANNISLLEYEEMSKKAYDFANKHFSSNSHYSNLIKLYTETIEQYKQ